MTNRNWPYVGTRIGDGGRVYTDSAFVGVAEFAVVHGEQCHIGTAHVWGEGGHRTVGP